MSKLERWLTLVANLSVVAGIVFLALQMRQNTQAIQSQTRDSITEKQMTWFLEGIGSSREIATIWTIGNQQGHEGLGEGVTPDWSVYLGLVSSNLREWENSYYQYERGLFSAEEFEARRALWIRNMTRLEGFRDIWATEREFYSPDFRAEIDRIVAEVERAQ